MLFETLGQFDESRFFSRLLGDCPDNIRKDVTDVLVPLSRRLASEVTGTHFDRLESWYPRWGKDCENYDYPEPENPHQFAHNAMLRRIEAEKGVDRLEGISIEYGEGRARIAVDAVSLWEHVNLVLPCMLQATTDEKTAMLATQEFGNQRRCSSEAYSLFETTVPSLVSVSWADVGEFKRCGGLGGLRQKIHEAFDVAAGDPQRARAVFEGFEDATTSEIIDRYRPRFRKVAVESILGIIPGLPVNPFGLFFSGRDMIEEGKKHKQLDWFYVLRDMRALSDQ